MGYVLFSKIWIEALSIWIGSRKCLEVMAETGALTYEHRKYGIDIIQEMSDIFADDLNLIAKYAFNGIPKVR